VIITQDNKAANFPEVLIIAKGAGIVFFGTIIGTVLKYIFDLIIARNLGSELFGLFFLGLAVFRVLESISTIGLHNGVLRYVALFRGENDIERLKGIILIAAKTVIIVGVCLALLLFALSNVIAVSVFNKTELNKALKCFAIAIPFSALTMIFIYATQGFKIMQYKIYVREIFEPISRIILAFLGFLLGWKLFGIIFIFVASIIIGTILSFHYLKGAFPEILKRKIEAIYEQKKLFKFSWPLFFVGVLNITIMWVNILMIGYFLTKEDVGVFSAAHRTALLTQVVLLSFNSIFAPIISDLHNRNEYNKLEKLFKITAKWTFSISFPMILLVAFFSKQILYLFGEGFVRGASCLIILAAGYLASSLVGSAEYVLMMTGKSVINFLNSLVLLIMIVILNLFLIPEYGIVGAALSTLLSFLFINIVRLIEVYLILRIHPYRINFFKSVIAGTLSLYILYLVSKYSSGFNKPLVLMTVGSSVFLGIYFLITYLLGIEEEEKAIINNLKDKIYSLRD
jgi:O-antigen/teichoic acid export membrane protein